MNQPVKRKRIPYGMMNFIDVREDNCYYVDTLYPSHREREQVFLLHSPAKVRKELNDLHAPTLL